MILQYSIVQATTIAFLFLEGVICTKIFVPEYSRSHVNTCDVDMRRAYAIGFLDSIEDTLNVHMYWLNVQGLWG